MEFDRVTGRRFAGPRTPRLSRYRSTGDPIDRPTLARSQAPDFGSQQHLLPPSAARSGGVKLSRPRTRWTCSCKRRTVICKRMNHEPARRPWREADDEASVLCPYPGPDSLFARDDIAAEPISIWRRSIRRASIIVATKAQSVRLGRSNQKERPRFGRRDGVDVDGLRVGRRRCRCANVRPAHDVELGFDHLTKRRVRVTVRRELDDGWLPRLTGRAGQAGECPSPA